MIDGTPLKWRQAKTGYYVPESFAPRNPDGYLLWSYAMAYRLSKDKGLWKMLRQLTKTMGIGDIGSPSGQELTLKLEVDNADWRVLYPMVLNLHLISLPFYDDCKMARRLHCIGQKVLCAKMAS
jgi:hypothetical protein